MPGSSIVARDDHTDEHVFGDSNDGDRVKAWAASGAFRGGGILAAPAALDPHELAARA